MSIPTPFNPMGTLGGGVELPYVQPIMTSYTDWSNKTGEGAASFGFTMTEAPNSDAKPAWRVFAAGTSVTECDWRVARFQESETIITFEKGKRLKLQRIDFTAFVSSFYKDFTMRVSASNNGVDWTQKGEIRTNVRSETGSRPLSIEIANPTYAKMYKLEIVDTEEYSMTAFFNLIGVYKQ